MANPAHPRVSQVLVERAVVCGGAGIAAANTCAAAEPPPVQVNRVRDGHLPVFRQLHQQKLLPLVLRALLRQRGFVLGLRLLAFASSARGLRLHAFRPVLRFQKRDVFDLSVLFRAKHRGFVRLPHRKTSHPLQRVPPRRKHKLLHRVRGEHFFARRGGGGVGAGWNLAQGRGGRRVVGRRVARFVVGISARGNAARNARNAGFLREPFPPRFAPRVPPPVQVEPLPLVLLHQLTSVLVLFPAHNMHRRPGVHHLRDFNLRGRVARGAVAAGVSPGRVAFRTAAA
mmetsp:Transcript_11213/g.41566  ORF Transcript_11213/g.41566 Transcript_11213/m.41566 type:complete len:285 (-) Transcript_11213:1596-2450(-)